MNNIFETRQRTTELLKEAIALWRQSDQSDYLEGLENDPVFTLLMMAVAYQGNEIDNEIERMKAETLDEFARQLTPYEIGHATPASFVVHTALNAGVTELDTGPNTVFRLASHPFISLMKTRVLNAKVGSVVRLDGRRWKVTLELPQPVKDLSRFTFTVNGLHFHDLNITLGNHPLPLIKPWDCSDLPFNDCFSPLHILFNRQQISSFSMLPMELFARHNVRMYCVDRLPAVLQPALDSERLELVFEFSGITDSFAFDKSNLFLNTLVLVNAEQHEVTLSSKRPFARLAGLTDDPDTDLTSRQFMHLFQPSDNQRFSDTELEVRRMNVERFNQGSLAKLLFCILNKYHSDFYAFQELKTMGTDKNIYNLQNAIQTLADAATEDNRRNTPGVYLMLKNRSLVHNNDFSLSVQYLTTAGASINTDLKDCEKLQSPAGFDDATTQVIASPVQGTDEITSGTGIHSMLRYYMLTGDRIVTPADIKTFCYKELQTRYGIEERMVSRMTVSHRQTTDRRDCGYEILTEITIADIPFVNRTFVPTLTTAEILIQKMIEVRSANIYPIRVKITIS